MLKSFPRAVLSVNAEMTLTYWDIGRMILERQEREGWGASVISRLGRDIRNELPEVKGFPERNIKLMVQFYREYPFLSPIGQRPVAQLTDKSQAAQEPRVELNATARCPIAVGAECAADAKSQGYSNPLLVRIWSGGAAMCRTGA
jgi:hypothetical protein